ncbi:hypothetical protein ASD00_36105 [Ensifer sp. Root31]|uniref:hypothetical protein n=1 Tax=Ensifer sp. Root31 TaxID=1736512 RepID=UPI00070BBF6E|nr:hypothetical protein [Ensifer sp. Root31]KQU79834.1 hypothetical protein ASD00_36105 [Ensifer sp. Root31]
MTSPYFIEGPALISFSGGRTSAYMLFKILEAHDGMLPPDVHVNFANTGKEREETLRFVHACASRWDVRVNWIEYREGTPGFEVVGYNSASRNGEPFQALIEKKQRLPNWKERWCTGLLKVQPMTDFATSIGLVEGSYSEIIGLRDDEGHRILKALHNAEFVKKGKVLVPRDPPRLVKFPLARAKVRKADVMAFWKSQPFDLGLEPWEGNCDLCFLKGRGIKKRLIREKPGVAPWWAANESAYKGKQERGWFDKRDSIAGLAAEVAASPEFFDEFDPEEYDVECGLHCALEAAE